MFKSIRILGLGPLEDHTFELDPQGVTEIAGPSEAGKSTLVEAACFALWGVGGDGKPFPVEAIRDGTKVATVTTTTARGTVLTRRLHRSRQQDRELSVNGDLQVFTREEDLAGKLGPVGAKAELGRLVLVPFYWVPLLQSELGRPLRDLLLSALPGGDLGAEVARLMGEQPLRDTDPLDAPTATRLQTIANRSRDEARGHHEAAKQRSRSSAEAVREPDAGELADAQGVLRANKAWQDHDQAAELHAERDAMRAQAAENADAWRRRKATLGEKPKHDAQALRAAGDEVKRLEHELSEARRAHQDRQVEQRSIAGQLDRARKAYADLRAAGDACPTCGRSGWVQASDRLAAAAADGEDLAARSKEAAKASAAAAAKVENLEQELQKARGLLANAEQLAAAPRSWEERMRALGPEPQVPEPIAAPTPPEVERPDDETVEDARRTQRAAVEAEGARKRAEQERLNAEQALRSSAEAFERADREAKRVEALVAATRKAPSEIARRQADALGDLGPVSLRFPERGGRNVPEIEVLIDGRPYWLASTGRQVLADLYLRCAIRRISGLHALPVAVDRIQDWSGEWPKLQGPIWMLRTQSGALTTRRIG